MSTFPRVTRFVFLAGPAALALTLLCAAPVMAQSLTNAFGGLSESSKDPIDIESDILEVHDKDKYATFKGNVKAVQGTTTLRARELKVHYVGGGKLASVGNKDKGQEAAAPAKTAGAEGGAPGDDENAQITKIEAKGQVVITSEKDQTTTSDWALYDVPAQQVTVGGNVVLTQGKNVLKGDRLVIDLKTGESRFDNTGSTAAGGRIRALFMPKGAAKAAKPGDAKSSEDDASSEKPAAGAEDETPADDDSPTNLWPPRSETEP